MVFKFLKYLQPAHYFSLTRQDHTSVFPVIKALPIYIKNQLKPYPYYKSRQAQEYDLSWQALQKGYIGTAKPYEAFESLPLFDEYCFARRYFSRFWVLYVFLVRICSFKNPVKEFKAFYSSRATKRSKYLNSPISYPDWNVFDSVLVKEQPKVSVIIPTLNRYAYLKDVLHDLELQDYLNFEVLVVDQSTPFKGDFYNNFKINLTIIQQEEKALWQARNNAIQRAKGDYLLFFDDDSRVEPNWITMHLKCLDFFKASISSGISISQVGSEVPAHYSFFRVSDQLDTGNVLIKKDVFETIGLYDRQFEKQRMGDGEFGLRAYLHGFLNISNPYAQRLHLKVGQGGLRELGSWDGFRPKSLLAPRPIPSVLYFYRRYFGNKQARWALLRTVPLSIVPYRFKKNKVYTVFGILLSILILPLVCIQVYRSWKFSSEKLLQGPLIDTLNDA